MKIYREQRAERNNDEPHLVGTLKSKSLEKSLSELDKVTFDLSKKENSERGSNCIIQFEDADFESLLNGINGRFKLYQSVITEIQGIAKDNSLSELKKIMEIKRVLFSNGLY